MHQQKQNVIVINSDPQVLKGLVLLLEDMQLKVISASHQDDLEKLKITLTDCPALLLLPFVFSNGESSIDLVNGLRASFNHQIPAILLSHENGLSHIHITEEDVVVLSDRIKPKDLRRNIASILNNALAV